MPKKASVRGGEGGGGGGGGESLFVHFRSYSRASPFNIMCNFVAVAMGNFTF